MIFGFVIGLFAWTFQTPVCGTHCGTERWAVKTVTDSDAHLIDTVTIWSSVMELRGYTKPDILPENRRISPLEFRIFKVHAWAIGCKSEADSDFHVVIADSVKKTLTMIAESPDTNCALVCGSTFRPLIASARRAVAKYLRCKRIYRKFAKPMPLTVMGVAFFDKIHGQTGVAPNGIELHPITVLQPGWSP